MMMSPLRRYRLKHKLSQSQLAALIGTTTPTVSRLETGDRLPSFAMVLKIVAVTNGNVTADDFMPARETAA